MHHAWEHGILAKDLIAMRDKLSATYGATDEDINGWLKYMVEVDWKYPTGREVNGQSFHRSLRMWVKMEREHPEWRGRRRGSSDDAAKREAEAERNARLTKIAADPESWNLCAERCAMFLDGKCSKGIKVPPAHWPHPCPPEECKCFGAKPETEKEVS